jgi:protein phosphatase PTC2/3
MTKMEMGGNTATGSSNNDKDASACSPSVAPGGVGDADEKSHTFRKRRLSLSRHHLEPEMSSKDATVSAAPTAALADENSSEIEVPPLPVVTTNTAVDNAERPDTGNTTCNDEDADADQKAHTFRKRRLSLTLNAPSLEEKSIELDEEDAETTPSGETEGTGVKRPRRASDASAASLASSTTGNQRGGLKVRTVHAGEIIHQLSEGPPSPALGHTASASMGNCESPNNKPHVLYRLSRPPSSTTLLSLPLIEDHNQDSRDGASPQPKWKKRITRKHDEDERKLPFPRDVVGTYSCHGVEPVYDSDYARNLDEDEVDDDELLRGPDSWTEDISGAQAKQFPTPNVGKPYLTGATNLRAKEPKPSTAAKINQDRGGVAFPYGNCTRTALFAAYDGELCNCSFNGKMNFSDLSHFISHLRSDSLTLGHGQGGELVSQFALHEVQSKLEKRPDFQSNLAQAFKDTFLAVDEALQHEPLIQPLYAGTTACVALLRENVLTVANAGDSRAVLARRKKSHSNDDDSVAYQAIDLTVDQNPDLPEERQRIESMGGFVSPPPEPGLSARVWLDESFSQIGLAMARSIGDHAVARVGVIAEPVVTTHTVDPDDEFLIIATDGVWEFLSSETAVAIVGANLSRGATKATQALIEAAAARWHDEEGDYRDDITALVVRLPELWKQDRLACSGDGTVAASSGSGPAQPSSSPSAS